MNITKIQLIGDNSGFLDVKENTSTPLTFSVADIKDLSKKKGAFSKSITLAGTKNNNILLGNYFDVNIQAGTFDINRIVECNILQNGIPVLQNGILQLVSVNKNQTNSNYEDELTYTVLVKDNIGDFFTQINNKELTDLTGFGWMNHIYNANNVIASFDNTITNGYKYIMPYTPEGQNTVNDASLDLTEFSPGIYAKIYFDKIFQESGYSYAWPTMDNNDVNFSKLIIPFNGEKPVVNAVEVIDYTSIVENVTPQTVNTRTQNTNFGTSNRFEITPSLTTKVIMPTEISDVSNRWNSSTSQYTLPSLASNQNSLSIDYEIDWELTTTSVGSGSYLKSYNVSFPFPCSILPSIKIRRSGTNQILATTNLLDNGNIIRLNEGTFIPVGTNTVLSGTTSFNQLVQGIDPTYQIEVAGAITTSSGWMFKSSNSINSANKTNTSFGIKIVNIRATVKTLIEGTYGYNIPVDMTRYIPQKIKQSDYIKSIFTMFNLFAEVDKDNPRRINLVSRDKYYDDGKINDWTKKLVKNEPQELKFLPEISSKSMTLTYKEDSDISNKVYKEATGEIYGQQKFTFDNEFVKEDKKTEIIFSPTPIFNTIFGAVCPMWLGGAPKCNLRILYDGGQYPCNTYNIVNYRLSSGTINQVSTNVYPYVGHWDKPVNPTFDLNFGVCDYYFRSDNFGSLTNNNLFNLHWRRTLNQINSGKIMTAYFLLNEIDILNVKLNDKIRIDNSWWNINKIQDYDANSTKPTKVELISIDETLKIPFQKRTIKFFTDFSNDILGLPIRTITEERNKFLTVNLSPYDIQVTGKYNYITADVTSASIIGDGNLISANSTVYGDNNIISAPDVTVYGDNNNIGEDGFGSTFYGNGFEGLSGNTIYTGNIVLSSGGTINGAGIPSGVTFNPTLQDVTDNGNLTTNSIKLDTLISGFVGELKSDLITGSNKTFQLPNQSGTFALTSDLALASSPVWKKSGLSTNASLSTEKIYRTNNTNLIGNIISFGTGPTEADIDNEVLGAQFGHIQGGGTVPFIQLLSNSGNGSAGTNNFIGRCVGAGINTAQMNFSAIKSTSYDAWGGSGRLLFRFQDGYLTPTSKFEIGTDFIRIPSYPSTRNDSGTTINNILFTDTAGYLLSRPITDLTGNLVTTNTNQTITGQKDFTTIFKTNTSGSGISGGGFNLGYFGSPYDRFDFVSRDDTDSDNFGLTNVYMNAEEGINFIQQSIDGTQLSKIAMNSGTLEIYNVGGGNTSLIRPVGTSAGVEIVGTIGKTARLKTSLITGTTKEFQFPNASGTLSIMRSSAPASATDTGVVGEYFADSSYLYLCIATDTWVRTAVSTW